jgi:DNA-binding CsgD family transcriptional regulator
VNEKAARAAGETTAPASDSLAARLYSERHRLFVGRDRELALFSRNLSERGGSLLFLSGQAGIGKSSLLRQYERVCLERGNPVALIDGAELPGQSPKYRKRLEAKIAAALGPSSQSRPQQPRPVLLVDGFEQLGRLQEWLLVHLVPRLSRHALLVFTSRCRAPPGLLLDGGWTSLLEQHELSPVTDAEAHTLLKLLEIPARVQAAIVEVAAGFPLALTLAAQVMRRSSRDYFAHADLREWQRLLVQVLCPETVSGWQRLCLDICAIARNTTTELIEHVFTAQHSAPGEHVQELFDWLTHQSFIERTAAGLRPHFLARLALLSRARQERPRKYNALNRSVREFCVEELGSGAIAESGLTDLFFLDRETPLVRRLGSPERDGEETPLEGAREADHPGIVELIDAREGPVAGQIAAARLQLEPNAFEIVRGDVVESVLHVTRFAGGAAPSPGILVANDPVTPLVLKFVREHPLNNDDEALFFRWFVDRRDYQTPGKRVFSISARQSQIIMSSKRIAYSMCVYRNPQDWAALFQTAGVPWEIVGRFTLDGNEYALLAFHLRERSLKDLLVNVWEVPAGETAAPASPNAAEETRIKVRQRIADLGRRVQLTPREHEILELLSLGGTPGDIATRLRIRPRTVKFHCENLIRKAGVSSRGDLFRLLL